MISRPEVIDGPGIGAPSNGATGTVRWARLSERAHIPAPCLSTESQYGAWRPVIIGKCLTLSVSKREPVRIAVAAIARSALSIV